MAHVNPMGDEVIEATINIMMADDSTLDPDQLRRALRTSITAAPAMRVRGRPAKAPEHQRQHYGVYFTEAERAAIQAVMTPGEDFSAFMREAARLLIVARR